MKKKYIKNLVLRNSTAKEKGRIVNAFRSAFANETDLNLRIGEEFISYVGGFLTKTDKDGHCFVWNRKWVLRGGKWFARGGKWVRF